MSSFLDNRIGSVSFRVHCAGIPQPRPKARRIGAGIQIYTPNSAKITEYKEEIKQQFLSAIHLNPGLNLLLFEFGLHLAVSAEISFAFKDPSPSRYSFDLVEGLGLSRKSHSFHLKKPDVDNLEKGVLDALKGVAWHDDSYVVKTTTEKFYTDFYLGGKSGRKVLAYDPYIDITLNYYPLER